MFGQYFGNAYFGDTYFGPAAGVTPPPIIPPADHGGAAFRVLPPLRINGKARGRIFGIAADLSPGRATTISRTIPKRGEIVLALKSGEATGTIVDPSAEELLRLLAAI